ncbi:hypothetical protein LTR66_002427 [Elasticomyces elasticus]|nr:hypothetical protein LTR66_002427 [Elasticomyces elasticus]
MGGSADEFPLLSALGLYAADIRGDGNCLFNALSDQLYGHQNQHHQIRASVISFMRERADYFKQFIDVHPGGGMRRNPKRKNAGAYSSPAFAPAPTPAEIDRVFEGHLQSMARGGTYGDNMEITAFSQAYNVDVKIYQRDFAYMVTGSQDDTPRDIAHIAYHVWEHYSSIRNLDGPHTGLPHVQVRALSEEEELRQKEKLAQTPRVQPWMIDNLAQALPYLADKAFLRRTLEDCKGNFDLAFTKLTDEEGGSVSSAQESSSVEREHDSDDDAYDGPNKKQDRRLSRATRTTPKVKAEPSHRLGSKLGQYEDRSQESIESFDSETSSHLEPPSSLRTIPDSADEEWQPEPCKHDGSEFGSTYSRALVS